MIILRYAVFFKYLRYSGNKSLLVYIMKIPMIFMIFSNVTVQKCTTFTLHRQAFTSSLPAIMVHDIEIFVKTNIIIISIIIATLHICHNHHNRWLCKSFESSVKFSTGYMKESALSVILFTECAILHMVKCFTHLAMLHYV